MKLIETINKLLHRKPTVGYVSDIDRFLAEFNARHPEKSVSQQAEIIKHTKIAQLRDHH